MRKVCLSVLCIAAFSFGCSSGEPEEPGVELKPVASTLDVMEGLMGPAAQNVWDAVRVEVDEKGTHEYQPQTREEWQDVAFDARGLAESANLLLMEGHLEDRGDWETLTKEMATTALAAAKAADDQDPDALMIAGGDMYEACSKCHEAYREIVQRKRTGGGTADTESQ